MNKVYDRPTLNMSAIMGANATEVLTEILVSMKNAVGDLLAEKTYIAIQSGILAGTPEDFGVVRYSAHLKKDYKANPDWVKLPKEDQPNYVKYFESPPVVQISINFPGLCQIRVTANTREDGSVVYDTIRSDVEGALSTLTYDDIMKSIESVKTLGLLTAPQFVEKLD